jgi:hypothetical protein
MQSGHALVHTVRGFAASLVFHDSLVRAETMHAEEFSFARLSQPVGSSK